jgi:predicted phosphodiesterase
MKIAVLSDVHANYQALMAVDDHISMWNADHVIVAGDLVNRGPRPKECLAFVQEKTRTQGWLTVRGNHEDYVIGQSNGSGLHGGPVFETHRASYWTYLQLDGDILPLSRMPFKQSLVTSSGEEARFVHASMRGKRDGIYPETRDRALQLQIGPPPALFCVGHTHRPLIRSLNGTLVVNAGSAGLPFDRDQRVAYAQITWSNGGWRARIVRLEYDLKAAEQDFHSTGYLENGGPLTRLVLRELRLARSQLYQWSCQYQQHTLSGQISMDWSVREFLSQQGLSI